MYYHNQILENLEDEVFRLREEIRIIELRREKIKLSEMLEQLILEDRIEN